MLLSHVSTEWGGLKARKSYKAMELIFKKIKFMTPFDLIRIPKQAHTKLEQFKRAFKWWKTHKPDLGRKSSNEHWLYAKQKESAALILVPPPPIFPEGERDE